MKRITLLLLLSLCPILAAAQVLPGLPSVPPKGPAGKIASKIEEQIKKQAPRQDSYFSGAQKALQDVMQKNPIKTISWKEFKALNNRAKERELVSLKMDLKLAQQQSAADKDKITFQNSWPDYTELLKGFTHIYIGEEHGTMSTPAETVRLLQALRKLHPDKRILLASEFSVTEKPNDSPLVQANEIHLMANLYPEVNQAADALNIDQLGLDSRYVSWEEDGHGSFLLIQCGKYLVKRYLTRQEEANIQELYPVLEMTVGASPFGILERNRQWVRYIKAVQPFYDIIVIYAGQGHIVNTLSNDLPALLDTPDFVNLIFVPTEDTNPDEEQTYISVAESTYRQNLGAFDQSYELKDQTDQVLLDQTEISGEWTDPKKPFWGQTNSFFPLYNKNIPGKEVLIYLPLDGVKMPEIKPLPKKEPNASRPQQEQPAASPQKLRPVAPKPIDGLPKVSPRLKNRDSLRYGDSYI